MPETSSDGIEISFDDTGRGEPAILYMPGWCASRRAFDVIAAKTAAGRRSLAMDWRGHGRSGPATADFGFDALVRDALAVIDASGATKVVPVATSHAGWVAIELRRRLGDRIPRLILVDWIVTEAPPPFLAALAAIQDPARWRSALEQLFASWIDGIDHAAVRSFVRDDMASYGFDMWSRACREIAAAYAEAGSPLAALSSLQPAVPTLHLYALPPDPAYLAAQRAFTASHPWFQVEKLDARSHFPTIEVPDQMVGPIERFVEGG